MEILLVALLLTLGTSLTQESPKRPVAVVRFKAVAPHEQASAAEAAASEAKPDKRPPIAKARPEETPAPLPQARADTPPPAQIIRISPKEMAALDIAALPRKPGPAMPSNRSAMGPPDTGSPSRDTPRVSGSGPHGEPLYAASWYREPYDDELSGYLSTASGPGWGLIACRTAPDFRVEDCVKVDEYPTGSNIARAVLAAAWQFRVRPPRIGGEPKIGEWVRIRIDYQFVAKSRP